MIIALSVFITICIFLDAYNVHKPSNKNFVHAKNWTFRWTKKCTATLNKNRQFVLASSIVSNIICAFTDIHCCISSNIISCCATCFAQIKMFLTQCYNSTVSLGYPPTCKRSCCIPSTLENALQNRPSWKWIFFCGLAYTRIESKASLYSKGCTACKQT